MLSIRRAIRNALLTICLAPLVASGQTRAGENVVRTLEGKTAHYAGIAREIWSFAEVGYQEVKSSALLQEELTKAGFSVERGVAEIPTAFVATYGSGKPVIALLGEFDALPGLSQAAEPTKRPLIEGGAGHACGHHLFGTASTAAAIAVKEWMQANGIKGTLRFYGTPAEEGGSGKVYMVRTGLFRDVDAVVTWHPGDRNQADANSTLANISAKFRFRGISSHAAAAPERGRSALDGVEAMTHMVNMLREHVPQETRIHYVITAGGRAPNVFPTSPKCSSTPGTTTCECWTASGSGSLPRRRERRWAPGPPWITRPSARYTMSYLTSISPGCRRRTCSGSAGSRIPRRKRPSPSRYGRP
jgi:aminobenzoyl-glutamate utilization protein B